MHRVFIALVILITGTAQVVAQDDGASCELIAEEAISAILDNCHAMENGTICAASGAVTIETADGQTVDQPGGTAPLANAKTITAGDGAAWSVAQLHLTDTLDDAHYATLLLFGPAEIIMETADNLPPGSTFSLTTEADPAPCGDLARPGVLVQAPSNSLTLLRVNGIDLAINGTAVIQAPAAGELIVSALTRETILGQSGTVVFAGYSAQVDSAGNVELTPYDPANVAHLPTQILPQIELIPLPGSGTVREETVLHLRPDASAFTGTQVLMAVPVSLFGRDASGAWMYIRTYDGATGWVPASALDVDGTGEMPTLEASGPPTVQRPLRPFGEVQARGLTTAESNNLRDGPGQNYQIITTVPLSTELDIYARSPDDEWFLVESPDGVRAWISVSIVDPVTPVNITELPYSPDFPG